MGKTLFEKVWDCHVVVPESDVSPGVVYIDLHLLHEVTSPQAFTDLRRRGIGVRCPDRCLATMDHSTPTEPIGPNGELPQIDAAQANQIAQLQSHCEEFGIELLKLGDDRRGIVHVIGPELGVTQPGMTIVCGDSHTSTHGAFGAIAFGIGTSEVGHVLATQCLLQRKPKVMSVRADGALPEGVTAKDLILAIIAQIGVGGGTGHALEYRGTAIEALSMEGRMTICNMSIEAGARCGMVAPDDTTFAYLEERSRVPKGQAFDDAVARWRGFATDSNALFDQEVSIDASAVEPMVTWGTNPGMGCGVSGSVPGSNEESTVRALKYMGLEPGQSIAGQPIEVGFIGSCTNARIEDLRAAASVLQANRISSDVRLLVVPGSQAVKRQAESEGLADVFVEAGAEWRESGCSMCLAMNGDTVAAGQYAISTSNRNFEGRQGVGARTLLASPTTVAASAIAGCVADPRDYSAQPVEEFVA